MDQLLNGQCSDCGNPYSDCICEDSTTEDKLKKYAEYRFELWSLLAEKSCIVLESELDEIQYLVLKNREYIEEVL